MKSGERSWGLEIARAEHKKNWGKADKGDEGDCRGQMCIGERLANDGRNKDEIGGDYFQPPPRAL